MQEIRLNFWLYWIYWLCRYQPKKFRMMMIKQMEGPKGVSFKITCVKTSLFVGQKQKFFKKMPKIAQNPLGLLFQFNFNFFLRNLFNIMTITRHKVYCWRQRLARTNPQRSRQSLRFRESFWSKIEAGFVCQEFNVICCMWF